MTIPEISPNQTAAPLIFSDDFSSRQLDRAKWNVRITGRVVNNEQQAYVDSDETVYVATTQDADGKENHVLVLHPRYRPQFRTADGQRFDFISGRIDTREKFHFTYGSASARMKLPVGAGLWPAFWVMGNGRWPENGEMDVMEYVGEPDWIGCAVHGPGYSGEAGLANKLFFQNGSDATAWHVYTVDWAPNQIVFKVDGLVIYRATRPMIDFFGPWVFDNDKFLILNTAVGGIYPFKTNGIRSPYYGLPEETVIKIKNNQAKVMIDWVRVHAIEE
ncbi:MAG: glycoside hydrolase family 16 protein [Anaerolineales bacterium]|nr:glycoside hydrolase family 16 protein [Anaerolineales bacterium]